MKITVSLFLLLCLNCFSQISEQKDSITPKNDPEKGFSFLGSSCDKEKKKLYDTISKLKFDLNNLQNKNKSISEEIKDIKKKDVQLFEYQRKTTRILHSINDLFFLDLLKNFYSDENVSNYQFNVKDTSSISKYKLLIDAIELDEQFKKEQKDLIEKSKKFNEIYSKLCFFKNNLEKKYDSTDVINSIQQLQSLSVDSKFKGLEKNKNVQLNIYKKYIENYNLFHNKFISPVIIKKLNTQTARKSCVDDIILNNKINIVDYPYLELFIKDFIEFKGEFKQ